MKRAHQTDIERDSIVFCDGIVGGIHSAVKLLTKETDNILILEPVHHLFKMIIKDLNRNSVLLTFISSSKTFNLGGLPQSLAIIPDSELRDKFKKGCAFRNYGNLLGIEALTAANLGDEYQKELMEYIEGNKDYFINYVRKNISKLNVIDPEGHISVG